MTWPRFSKLSLVMLTLVYLGAELIFNAWVLEVAATAVDVATMETLAHTGRLLAAIGAALLMVKLTSGVVFRRFSPDLAAWVLFSLTVLTAVGTYHGEKYLLERAVDATAPDQRLASRYGALARAGVLAGDVEVGDIPAPGLDAPAADQAFHVLFGGLLLTSPDVVMAIRGEAETLLTNLAEASGSIDALARYRDYRRAMEELRTAYASYSEGVSEVESAEANPRAYAREEWADINNQIRNDAWGKYAGAMDTFDAEVRDVSKRIAPELQELFGEYKHCLLPVDRNQRRCARVESAYEEEASQHLSGSSLDEPPPMSYWCEIPGSVLLGLVGPSRSERAEAADCAKTPEDVEPYVQNLLHQDFRLETGYSYGLSRGQFLAHPDTVGALREELRDAGIQVSSDWQPSDVDEVVGALAVEVVDQARREYRQAMNRHFGEVLPRHLSWSEFFAHEAVRDLIREEVGAEVEPSIRWDMTRQAFQDEVIAPRARRELHTQALAFERDVLVDPDQARDAVYLALVPPVALSVSLFFGLLNAGHLLLTALLVVVHGYPRIALALRTVGWVALGTALLVAPFMVFDRQYTNPDAVDAMTERFDERLAPGVGHALQWVLRTQPHVAPVGSALLEQCRAVRLCPPPAAQGVIPTQVAREGQQASGDGVDPATIRWAQRQLQALGHYDNRIDGAIGANTRAAVRAFRDEQALPVSSEIDAVVLLYLGARAREAYYAECADHSRVTRLLMCSL